MKIDTTMVLENPARSVSLAKELEDAGYDTAYSFEGQHDPFLPLAMAATSTSRITLGTGIAVAFARNPMSLAYLSHDLQQIAKGRFILGLGTQIQAHIEKRFSCQWSQPVSRMKEYILATKAILSSWQQESRLHFEGDFFRHSLMTPAFNPGPNPFGMAKIFAAGVGPKMTEAMGEVADGFFIHPFNTGKSVENITLPRLRAGLNKAGKKRQDIELSCSIIIGTGSTEEALNNTREKVRRQIAFYASTPAYKPVLDCHNWGELQPELNRLSKSGKWESMSALISDEMLDEIAIVCERKYLAERLFERCNGKFDRLNFIARYTADNEHWRDVVGELKTLLSNQKNENPLT
ncbi:MAG: TIGR03617 family F420-dependent LLM class oxidoreductase [Pseudomonadales bacterium]|nr:TIGR03617 family F420-dependent LLM class oxidoreductase [Pseudomonadales bacterium]